MTSTILGTELVATPLPAELVSLLTIVGSIDNTEDGGEFGLISLVDGLEGDGGGGLLVNELTETSLSLDDGVRYAHLTAKSMKPYD